MNVYCNYVWAGVIIFVIWDDLFYIRKYFPNVTLMRNHCALRQPSSYKMIRMPRKRRKSVSVNVLPVRRNANV